MDTVLKVVWSFHSVEPRYKEVPRDWQNLFAITRFRYMEVLFHIFYCYWGKENRLLNRGLRYIEFRYIEVSLEYVHSCCFSLFFCPLLARL